MKLTIMILSVSLLLQGALAFAETHEVGQKNKEFTIRALTLKQGDKVKFINLDTFFHNVFSLSDAAMFDLGSFPEGQFKEVVFDQVGTVEVECAIHPNMKMVINVEN
jgi:plastocyanin